MEWDPSERDAWAVDAQRWIGQIKGVLQCKIDLDEAGEVSGVHVVAGMDREPRHIVRDVESLLKARLGLDVYYKKIGVVQVLDNGTVASGPVDEDAPAPLPEAGAGPTAPAADPVTTATATATAAAPEPVADVLPDPVPAVLVAEESELRLQCVGVGVMVSDRMVRAEVQLCAGDVEARGTREGANHAGGDVHLVAEAALAALAELITDPVLLQLREVRLDTVGGEDVVIVAVGLVEGRRTETYFGSCGAGHNRQQAIVHAVLDALNRRLALLSLKTLPGE